MDKPSDWIQETLRLFEYDDSPSTDSPIFKLIMDYFGEPSESFWTNDLLRLTYNEFNKIQAILESLKNTFQHQEKEIREIEWQDENFTNDTLKGIARIAKIYDESGDPELMKKAEVLDEVLFTISNGAAEAIHTKKAADQAELDRLRATYKRKQEDLYKGNAIPKEAEQAQKKVLDQIPQPKLNQNPLSHRNCPDHPGTQTVRLADGTFQCSLDRKVYSFRDGFTKMDGIKVPGGAVENQTKFDPGLSEQTAFNTRETRINS